LGFTLINRTIRSGQESNFLVRLSTAFNYVAVEVEAELGNKLFGY